MQTSGGYMFGLLDTPHGGPIYLTTVILAIPVKAILRRAPVLCVDDNGQKPSSCLAFWDTVSAAQPVMDGYGLADFVGFHVQHASWRGDVVQQISVFLQPGPMPILANAQDSTDRGPVDITFNRYTFSPSKRWNTLELLSGPYIGVDTLAKDAEVMLSGPANGYLDWKSCIKFFIAQRGNLVHIAMSDDGSFISSSLTRLRESPTDARQSKVFTEQPSENTEQDSKWRMEKYSTLR